MDDTLGNDHDPPIRGEIRLVELRRVNHGLGVRKRVGLTHDQEFRRDLRAYLLVLPPSAVFTHVTAARLLGWDLPKLPDQVPVFAAVDGNDRRPRRQGLICSRLVRVRDPAVPAPWAGRLPVDLPEEILLRAARDLGLLDLLILLESALTKGHIDAERMEALLATRRPGVRMLREAWRRATGRSESAGETLLQQFHRTMDVPFEPQAEIFDDDGTFIGRADILLTGTMHLHEYDGEHHRSKAQQKADLRRTRALTATSYERRGFVLDDLLNHAAVAMHEIDRVLGRPHALRRLRRWRRLVENSLYSDQGRERVLNRWRRQRGLVDWTGSA